MTFRERLQKREVVFGTMVRDALTFNVVEASKSAGLDFFVLDMEHTAVDLSVAGPLLQYAQAKDFPVLVRVPTLDKAFIGRVLDCGAAGIWLPHVDTAEDARKLAALSRYPPLGTRGGTIPWSRRAQAQSFAKLGDFFAQLDSTVALVGQIESGEAVNNIEAILSTGLLDALVIEPLDLSMDLGVPGELRHRAVEEAIAKVVEAAREKGVSVGLHTGNLEDLKAWRVRGMNFLVYSYDLALMAERAAQARKEIG